MDAARLGVHLVLHGSVCLLVGLLCGAPLGRTINNAGSEASVHGWRVAHLGLSLGGPLLFSVAAVLPIVSGGSILNHLCAWSFVVSAYGFIVSLPLGARLESRGLSPSGGVRQVVYLGNVVGAVASLVGCVCLVLLAGGKLWVSA